MISKATDMLKRISGFSTAVFGVSWTPPASDRDALRKLLAFLEDRRALFNPFPAEIEDHVISSVNSIRTECAATVGILGEKSQGVRHVRAIGAACRRFLDDPYPKFDDILAQRRDPYFDEGGRTAHLRRDTSREGFFTALGELRAFIGMQIAILSVLYEIDIHGDLASILPPVLDDNL